MEQNKGENKGYDGVMSILIIEDSPKMGLAMKKGLTEFGFAVTLCDSGREGEELAAGETFDVIVLDVMLTDHDGMDLCRNLRRREVKTPILMLTALSGTDDKVAGLDAGADDYLTKPFEFEELVARVRALMRRAAPSDSVQLQYADLEMDLARRTVCRGGQEIDLTTKEFAFLEYMMRHPERVLSRAVIGENVWDMNFDPFSNVIDVYISNLRRKIDKPFDSPLIQTKVGAGYMLLAKSKEEEPAACEG